jgi:hypothetical protein
MTKYLKLPGIKYSHIYHTHTREYNFLNNTRLHNVLTLNLSEVQKLAA